MALVVHVTYFVPQIVPFIEKLQRSMSGARDHRDLRHTASESERQHVPEVINGQPMALVA